MDAKQKKQIETTVIRVFEQFAFMFARLVEDEDFPGRDAPYTAAVLPFFGPFTGQLTLAVSSEECVVFAANVLGTSAEDREAQEDAEDSLKEVVNVLCGQLLTEIAGDEVVFNLAVPGLQILDQEKWAALLHDAETLPFIADDVAMLIRLHVD
jgi:CheY-specific phosphatase CheX